MICNSICSSSQSLYKDFGTYTPPVWKCDTCVSIVNCSGLYLFIVTPAGPCHHLYLYSSATFFEISRLILCTSSLTTKTDLHTWKSGKGNKINSTSAWDLESIKSRGASVLLTAGWTYLFIFPFLCHVVHVSLELFACHLCDWQSRAKPVSRVACLLSRNSG